MYLFRRGVREVVTLATLAPVTEAKRPEVARGSQPVLSPHNPAEERKARVVLGRLDLASMPYQPWPMFEAKRLAQEARRTYLIHSHEDPDTQPVSRADMLWCVACRLRNVFGSPPAVEGWERTMVQACQPIKLRYINAVLRNEGEAYSEDYRTGLARDVQTFGLVITSW